MKNEPGNEPRFVLEITGVKKRFSIPKLYIPRKNGRAVIDNRRWYVYFYWRTDPNGVLDKKIQMYKGLNHLKSVKERRKIGKSLANGYHQALLKGWNPTTGKTEAQNNNRSTTIGEALEFALKTKKRNLSEATITDYTFRLGMFTKWLEDKSILALPVEEINVNHIYDFLDYLQLEYKKEDGKGLSNTSINNTKGVISALFTELKDKRLIENNFVRDIPRLKSKPKKNRPFSISEMQEVVEQLRKEDPYLIDFISFMFYPILRPREIVRLTVGDVNTTDWLITAETKTEAFSIRRVIDKMKPIIEEMKLDKKPKGYSLFSPEDKPAVWETKRLDSKVSYFSKRFTKVIRAMGFSEEYTLYSVRHTAISIIYNGFQKQGKNEREIIQHLMPITGHSSEAGLRNYLRDISIVIPPDYSDVIDFDF